MKAGDSTPGSVESVTLDQAPERRSRPAALVPPAHARPLHPLRCQRFARSFDESAADRQVLLQERVVSHLVTALLHEAEHPPEGVPLRSRASVLTVAQPSKDSLRTVLEFSQRQPFLLEGWLGFCAPLAIVGRLDLRKDMKGVHCRVVFRNADLRRQSLEKIPVAVGVVGAIGESYQLQVFTYVDYAFQLLA